MSLDSLTSRCTDCGDKAVLSSDALCGGCTRLRTHKVLQTSMRALCPQYLWTCALCLERTAGVKCGLCPAHLEEVYGAGEFLADTYLPRVREATDLKDAEIANARRAADRFDLNPDCCLMCGKHCGTAACPEHIQQVVSCTLEEMDGLCEDRVQAHKHKILLSLRAHHSLCALCDLDIDRETEFFAPFQKLCTAHWAEFNDTGCLDLELARAKASERVVVKTEPVVVAVPQPARVAKRELSVKDLKQPVKKLTKKEQLALVADAPKEYTKSAPKDDPKETPLQKLYRKETIGFNEYAQRREPERWSCVHRSDLGHATKRKVDDSAENESMVAACTPLAIDLLQRVAEIRAKHPRFCNRHDLQPKLGLYPWEITLREFHFVAAQHEIGMVADDQREAWDLLPDEMQRIRPEQCRRTRANRSI